MNDPESSVAVRVGDLIAGKYRVDRLLGAGGMGVVVAATHIDLDRPVAVKLIREELASEPSTVERLMFEARAAAKIQSEHVGRVLDVGKLPSGAPYIVMEYLHGCDLCQVLEQQGALRITQAIDFLMQACEALAEAHAAHIVHRDLKPENLFVARQPDGSSTIKVLDFGISKQLGDTGRRQLTNPSTAVGSPRYMAPEQMQAGEVDVRADIWSLGAILYECLSNNPAFDSDTLPGICAQVLSQEPRPIQALVAHIPDRLAQVIGRCLKKNREERFGSVAEFADALAPFGTDRAQLSRRRITALLGGPSSIESTIQVSPLMLVDAQGTTAVVQTGPGHGSVVDSNTAGRGIAVDVDSSGSTLTSPRKRRTVWPWIAAPVFVLGGLTVAFVAMQEPKEETAEFDVVAALTAATHELSTAPSAADTSAEPNDVQPQALPERPDAGASKAALAKKTAAPAEPSKPRKPRKPAKPKEADPPKDERPKGNDAWDPDSFGGRQ